MKAVPHPAGIPILFDSKWHQYKVGGVTLRSVSKVLDRFFPFDEKHVLAMVSRKTGEPVDVIKEKWSRQALLGKNVHEYIECQLRNQPPPTFCMLLEKLKSNPEMNLKGVVHGEEPMYLPVAEKAVHTVLEHYDVLAVEQVVACPSLGIAGTIDLLARNKSNGNILIGDWKTTGSVKSNFRFGSFETSSAGCLRHLPNSKMYRYALQIAIYGEILRREKYFENDYFGKLSPPALCSQPAELPQDTNQTKKKKVKKPKKGAAPASIDGAEKPHVFEYGLIQMSKLENGSVGSEFIGISEATILPLDQPELTFPQLLSKVLHGEGL